MWSTDKYKERKHLLDMIWRARAKFQVLFNLTTFSNYSITNYVKIPAFHFLKKVKNGKYQLLKIDVSGYIVISFKS